MGHGNCATLADRPGRAVPASEAGGVRIGTLSQGMMSLSRNIAAIEIKVSTLLDKVGGPGEKNPRARLIVETGDHSQGPLGPR
jgi:hypothetical protein